MHAVSINQIADILHVTTNPHNYFNLFSDILNWPVSEVKRNIYQIVCTKNWKIRFT